MSATDRTDMMLSCANCGKGEENSNKLKKCSACLSVKYCSTECQKAHRPQHKKECKNRAAELYDEKLFKEVDPEDCPICMLPLQCGDSLIECATETFMACCGKIICNGCIYAMNMSDEGATNICPFCREPNVDTDEEYMQRLLKLVDNGNAGGYFMLARGYADGDPGLVQDQQKANELYLKAGELGYANGYYNLGNRYREGIGVKADTDKAQHYLELAAMGGRLEARHNLGTIEIVAGNHHRAVKHMIMAAKAGDKLSLHSIKEYFMHGFVTKDEYASTLRAHQKSLDEMKSEMRDKAQLASDLWA